MKKIKFFSLFLTALMMCGTAWAQDPALKFDATITSSSTVRFTVDEEYMATLYMPDATSCSVDPSQVTVNVKMHNVASLGISGDREAESTISTGVSHSPVSLTNWLGNIYSFNGATMPIEVISNGTTKNCQYEFSSFYSGYNTILINPASEDAMRAAWWEITSHVTPSKQATDDSYLTLKKGSYLQMGDERLEILQDFDFFKGQWSFANLIAAFVSAQNTYVGELNITDKETYKTEIFFEAGSVLALGQTLATLDDACTVTFDCTAAYQSGSARKSGILSGIMSDINNETTTAGKTYVLMVDAVQLVNDIVGQVDAADNVPATVEFDAPVWTVIRGEGAIIVPGDDALEIGEIGTFCVKQKVQQIRGGVVYQINERIGEVTAVTAMDLVEAQYPLEASRPYIFKATADKLEGILIDDEVATAGSYNGLIGKYEKYDITPFDNQFMIYQNKVQLCGYNCYINAGLAYIDMENVPQQGQGNAPGRKHMVLDGRGATTALENMTIVPAEGIQKMMVGGQFIIVKNGKMFNAQGAQL